ncbi:hypothetical protein ACFFX0_27495 [Citricoccus parietis]|uniref:Uncharacterized protein n=1 Tax=Citricoccus parietis TaxID=592307 RepID=A0ABV5G721_9MICC
MSSAGAEPASASTPSSVSDVSASSTASAEDSSASSAGMSAAWSAGPTAGTARSTSTASSASSASSELDSERTTRSACRAASRTAPASRGRFSTSATASSTSSSKDSTPWTTRSFQVATPVPISSVWLPSVQFIRSTTSPRRMACSVVPSRKDTMAKEGSPVRSRRPDNTVASSRSTPGVPASRSQATAAVSSLASAGSATRHRPRTRPNHGPAL